jgi:hypothetical protein
MHASVRADNQHPPIRVLASNLPSALFEAFAPRIREQPDMFIVGSVQGQLQTLLAAREGADVVLLGARSAQATPGLCTQLLGEFPRLTIVVLSFDGEASRVYWQGMRRHKLRHVSSASIVTAIRGSRNLA